MPGVVVGIDPGLDGAVAVWRDGSVETFSLPTVDVTSTSREIDAGPLMLRLLDIEPALVVIEKVNAQPKWGAAPSFKFGQVFGALLAVIDVGGWAVIRVRPQEWKKTVLGPGPSWSKDMAVQWVRTTYPEVNLMIPGKRGPSHDMAEAVCLAQYGVWRNGFHLGIERKKGKREKFGGE